MMLASITVTRRVEGHIYNDQKENGKKGHTMIYKTLHRKLKIDQHENH
jgi:hypothetical protein